MSGSPCCAPSSPRRPTGEAGAEIPPVATERLGATDGMVLLDGGQFMMGHNQDDGYPADGEGPMHPVRIDPFWIDTVAVTNEKFATFVDATGYRTESEVFGWSFVFAGFLPDDFPPTRSVAGSPWWRQVEGADWRHPDGAHSDLSERMDHPVVHVSWNDARAYCAHTGLRLPTEAEWEYAARGGITQAHYPWGHHREPDGEHRMNVWQGTFPNENTAADGYVGTAPVDAFPPNGYGLRNMTGNVWEWCHDWFDPATYRSPSTPNPAGPRNGTHRVMRGGSYLCHDSYCFRYRVDSRSANTPDSATGNLGFRCVRDS